MAYPISIEEFKTYFAKDFIYGNDSGQVSDADISRAMSEADMNFNAGMFEDENTRKMIFYYLTAFYLVFDMENASSQGGSGSSGLVSHRRVRNVEESFAVPQWALKDPLFSQFASNGYGRKYLNMIYPYLIGRVSVVPGASLP